MMLRPRSITGTWQPDGNAVPATRSNTHSLATRPVRLGTDESRSGVPFRAPERRRGSKIGFGEGLVTRTQNAI